MRRCLRSSRSIRAAPDGHRVQGDQADRRWAEDVDSVFSHPRLTRRARPNSGRCSNRASRRCASHDQRYQPDRLCARDSEPLDATERCRVVWMPWMLMASEPTAASTRGARAFSAQHCHPCLESARARWLSELFGWLLKAGDGTAGPSCCARRQRMDTTSTGHS